MTDLAAKVASRRRAGPKMRSHVEDSKQALMWQALRGHPRRPWTAADLAEAADASIHTARYYLRALTAAGIMKMIDEGGVTQQGGLPAVWRACGKLGPLTPIVRGQGGNRVAFDPNRTQNTSPPPTRR